MKVFALACSLRRASLNKKLLGNAVTIIERHGVEVDLASLADFDLPLLNWDLVEDQAGAFPPAADALKARFLAADAFVLATPEYNYSVSAPVKNAIDWLSRYRPMPFRDKPGMLMAASISVVGGIRGLWQTRIPLEGCGALLYSDMFALPVAHTKLDADGTLTDPELLARLDQNIAGFLGYAKKLTSAT